METKLLTPNQIDEAVSLLKAGELVAFPTETVYGLGGCVFNPAAIEKIFIAKRRPQDNPLIAHISKLEEIEQLACDIPSLFFPLVEAFWPGPLTMILPRQPRVPAQVALAHQTIAVRFTAHALARQLIALTGEPLVAPSANLSGRPSSTTAQHVWEDLQGAIAAVLDGGPCQLGIESTVISLINNEVHYLRPGLISREAIEKVIGKQTGVSLREGISPGMKYRHYAPRAAVVLFDNACDAEAYHIRSALRCRILHPKTETLYASFRQADAEEVEVILAIVDRDTKKNCALYNRLLKASERGTE